MAGTFQQYLRITPLKSNMEPGKSAPGKGGHPPWNQQFAPGRKPKPPKEKLIWQTNPGVSGAICFFQG